MNLIPIYEGLADPHRLRIIHLLMSGPLGVKHLQALLGVSQVRVSKHLAYLRKRRMVEVDRHRNWMLYRLPASPVPEFAIHLKCLAECLPTAEPFRTDLHASHELRSAVERVRQLGRPAVMDLPPGARAPVPEPAPSIGLNLDGNSDYID